MLVGLCFGVRGMLESRECKFLCNLLWPHSDNLVWPHSLLCVLAFFVARLFLNVGGLLYNSGSALPPEVLIFY